MVGNGAIDNPIADKTISVRDTLLQNGLNPRDIDVYGSGLFARVGVYSMARRGLGDDLSYVEIRNTEMPCGCCFDHQLIVDVPLNLLKRYGILEGKDVFSPALAFALHCQEQVKK